MVARYMILCICLFILNLYCSAQSADINDKMRIYLSKMYLPDTERTSSSFISYICQRHKRYPMEITRKYCSSHIQSPTEQREKRVGWTIGVWRISLVLFICNQNKIKNMMISYMASFHAWTESLMLLILIRSSESIPFNRKKLVVKINLVFIRISFTSAWQRKIIEHPHTANKSTTFCTKRTTR